MSTSKYGTWRWGGSEAHERGDTRIHKADSCFIQQKQTHYKAIILQLKKNSFRFTEKLRILYKRAPTVYHAQFLYC